MSGLVAVRLAIVALAAAPSEGPAAAPTPFQIRLDAGHLWRPPFGLDRIGRPAEAAVETAAKPAEAGYVLAAFHQGKEIGRRPLRFPDAPPFVARATFEGDPDELVLSAERGPAKEAVELARQAVRRAGFEAEAVARPDRVVNPVDLGTILVPNGWLLLGTGQSATVDVAALSRSRNEPGAKIRAWFESSPDQAVSMPLPLRRGLRAAGNVSLPPSSTGREKDAVRVVVDGGDGRELWAKTIPVMRVNEPPRRPGFGATYERLRYDAPISVRDPKTGAYSTKPYEEGWGPDKKDVVVSLPNGARFVFWRGASYIPFWAGRFNTGACYEWVEILSHPTDAVDCVEPLMDKELRYGRVDIVASTPARVHVRWTYQSTDLHYKVWGDQVSEDYYFYPDGFGTRVVDLRSAPENDYELSEFILLTPQGAYPFEVLPENLVDALFLDGRKHEFRYPLDGPNAHRPAPGDGAAVYRLRLNKQETLSAVYFNPNETKLPPVVFAPFFDAGRMVTPCYWGSHWPLARGNATGNAIDDRIALTPTHNSVMSWAKCKPTPLRTASLVSVDTLGRSRPMTARRWAWLVGMTDASDAELLDRAKSFATPPSLDLRGVRLDVEAYAPERRSIGLVAEGREIAVTIKPGPPCVNPVFEIAGAPAGAIHVALAGRPLDAGRFAWDGRTLWLDATVKEPTELQIRFDADVRRAP